MGLELLPSPVHMRPAEPDPLPPLCGRHKWMAPKCVQKMTGRPMEVAIKELV